MKVAKLKKNHRLTDPLPIDPIVNRIMDTKPAPTRLDLGCGPGKKQGFTGVDSIAFPGVDVVMDLRQKWPWADNSIEEVHSSHFVEHLWNTDERPERVHFVNELYRVMRPNAKATIICPYWSSCRAYGDFTHAYPPVSSFWFYYLKKDWRSGNAPHNDIQWNPKGYTCNFEVQWGFSLHPEVALRNQEYQQYAMNFLVEACQDVIATLTCIK